MRCCRNAREVAVAIVLVGVALPASSALAKHSNKVAAAPSPATKLVLVRTSGSKLLPVLPPPAKKHR